MFSRASGFDVKEMVSTAAITEDHNYRKLLPPVSDHTQNHKRKYISKINLSDKSDDISTLLQITK